MRKGKLLLGVGLLSLSWICFQAGKAQGVPWHVFGFEEVVNTSQEPNVKVFCNGSEIQAHTRVYAARLGGRTFAHFLNDEDETYYFGGTVVESGRRSSCFPRIGIRQSRQGKELYIRVLLTGGRDEEIY
jgi:hypothetical protein